MLHKEVAERHLLACPQARHADSKLMAWLQDGSLMHWQKLSDFQLWPGFCHAHVFACLLSFLILLAEYFLQHQVQPVLGGVVVSDTHAGVCT